MRLAVDVCELISRDTDRVSSLGVWLVGLTESRTFSISFSVSLVFLAPRVFLYAERKFKRNVGFIIVFPLFVPIVMKSDQKESKVSAIPSE